MPEETSVLEAAQAFLDGCGAWSGTKLLSHSVHLGMHTFKGTCPGHRNNKPSLPGSPPSDTIRFVAREEQGTLVGLEEISTSERKYIQAHGKLPIRLRPHFLEPQMDKIRDSLQRLQSILQDPQPGLATWHKARAEAAQELYDLLDPVVPHPKVQPKAPGRQRKTTHPGTGRP